MYDIGRRCHILYDRVCVDFGDVVEAVSGHNFLINSSISFLYTVYGEIEIASMQPRGMEDTNKVVMGVNGSSTHHHDQTCHA